MVKGRAGGGIWVCTVLALLPGILCDMSRMGHGILGGQYCSMLTEDWARPGPIPNIMGI